MRDEGRCVEMSVDSAWSLEEFYKAMELLPGDAKLLVDGDGEYEIQIRYTLDEAHINLRPIRRGKS